MSGLTKEWTLGRGRLTPVKGPLLTVVMDGIGLAVPDLGNAVHHARTPVLDALWARSCLPLAAHGLAVGLPSDGDMGNSEVGHNALGAGRVFAQGAKLVNDAIYSGRMFEEETWRWLLDGVRASGQPLHFIGLLSDGNVHSHQDHLHAMLRRAATDGVKRVRIHALLDGRDVGARTALVYLGRLNAVLNELNTDGRDYKIASGGGRMVLTMDRYEAEWGMIEAGWRTHVLGEGQRFEDAEQAVKTLYEASGQGDQFLPAFVIADADGPVGPIRDGASVCLFNFRGDRAIEISRALTEPDLDTFERGALPDVRYAGMMQYDGDLKIPARFLVVPPAIDRTAGEYLARNGISQFACSETQKFGHVTYFWNGNRSGMFDDGIERYQELKSDVVPFEQRPWMKAAEIVEATVQALRTGTVRHARINLPNGDMVGHTGDLRATILGVEAVDIVLGRLLDVVATLDGVALVTADHGNADEMFEKNKDGSFKRGPDGVPRPRTSHTLNPVPLSLFDPKAQVPMSLKATVARPGLANVAATTMELLGLKPPEDYEPSLLG